jgi:hypothetical protein
MADEFAREIWQRQFCVRQRLKVSWGVHPIVRRIPKGQFRCDLM